MTLKKQPTTDKGTTSKGKYIAIVEGIIRPSNLNFNPIVERTVYAPSQGVAGDVHPPSTYGAQLLQMFAGIREEMAKQQALFDHERKQAAHDRENTACEREEMKCLTDQFLAQITAFQNTRRSPPSPERTTLRRPKEANILKAIGDASQTPTLSKQSDGG